jgi:hypothetical protein
VVARPIFQARVHDLQLEGEHLVEEVCPGLGRFDVIEDSEKI